MFILTLAALAVIVFLISIGSSLGRRSGLLELGSVSTHWLAEHRQYQEGDRSR
jgi:hypothetical protein